AQADCLSNQELPLHRADPPRSTDLRAAPIGDHLEQPRKAHDAGAEDGAMAGELALGVLDVAEGRDDEDRLVVEPRPIPAQDLACLAGVGGTGDELERHGSTNVCPSRDAVRALV